MLLCQWLKILIMVPGHILLRRIFHDFFLKTLVNIVVAPFKKSLNVDVVLYDDVQMDQYKARNTKVSKFMRSLSKYLWLNIPSEFKRSGLPFILTQLSMGRNE